LNLGFHLIFGQPLYCFHTPRVMWLMMLIVNFRLLDFFSWKADPRARARSSGVLVLTLPVSFTTLIILEPHSLSHLHSIYTYTQYIHLHYITHSLYIHHGPRQTPKYTASRGCLRGPRDLHRRPPPSQTDRIRSGLYPMALLGRHTRQRTCQSPRQ
jgi:hypothetical protein